MCLVQQVCRELHCILELLQPVAYRSEAEQDSDDSLQGMLGQLKHTAQLIAHSETLQVQLFSMEHIMCCM